MKGDFIREGTILHIIHDETFENSNSTVYLVKKEFTEAMIRPNKELSQWQHEIFDKKLIDQGYIEELPHVELTVKYNLGQETKIDVEDKGGFTSITY